MIKLKTNEEIAIMADGGQRLRKVVSALLKIVKPGMTTLEIDELAEELIIKEGGESSFNKVKGYKWCTCLTINEQAVHTPPSKRVLKNGDVLTIDIGMYYKGFHTDYSTTFVVGDKKDEKIEKFLQVGKDTLDKAIKMAKAGNRLGEISNVIEKEIYGNGYFILKELTGHGIGRGLHEDPYVFGFNERPIEKTIVIKPGLVIAIEIIYSMGSEQIAYEEGISWSIISADRSLAACFEHTVAIMEDKSIVLT